jgi:hypothetical protein
MMATYLPFTVGYITASSVLVGIVVAGKVVSIISLSNT